MISAGAHAGLVPRIPKLADRIATGLYARIAAGAIDQLDAVFCRWRTGQPALLQTLGPTWLG